MPEMGRLSHLGTGAWLDDKGGGGACSVLAAQLCKEVGQAGRDHIGSWNKVVMLGKALGHALKVAVTVCFATKGEHVGKVVYLLMAFEAGKPIGANGGVCPQNINVCTRGLPSKLASNRAHCVGWRGDATCSPQPQPTYVQGTCTAPD